METAQAIDPCDESTVLRYFDALKELSLHQRGEPIANRKKRLKDLLRWIQSNRDRVKEAVFSDFNKPPTEVDISEIYPVVGEIRHALRHIDRWARPVKIDAPFNYLGTRSEVRYEPKGVCLILSPWNFPFNLALGPLVSCLAAGNTAILKPSELTPYTARLLGEMVKEVFHGEVMVVEGGAEVAGLLLRLPFDHLFFTGSPAIGKVVMKAAADHLTSVTLELGGKSPAIIDQSANITETAKRIAFGKFLNNGQTCIAPDYLLVHHSVAEPLINALKKQVTKLFGDKNRIDEHSPSYGRIVNSNHFQRLKLLLEDATQGGAKIEMGGAMNSESRFFHPVILSQVPAHARLMEEEIFGPILPIIPFGQVEEVVQYVNSKPKPLALYIFGQDKSFRKHILDHTSSGTACVNDCVLQFTHPNLPFGGVNNSGIGKSHGYYGFLAFSNQKPVLRQKSGFTLSSFFYPPFTPAMRKRIEPILRWF